MMATRTKGKKKKKTLIIRRKELLVRIKIRQVLQKVKKTLAMEAINEAILTLRLTGSIQTTSSLIKKKIQCGMMSKWPNNRFIKRKTIIKVTSPMTILINLAIPKRLKLLLRSNHPHSSLNNLISITMIIRRRLAQVKQQNKK